MKLLLDTNVIVDFLKQGDASYNLFSLLQSHDCYTSIIVKLELLKFPDITPDEEHIITEFLQLIPIITFNEAIERQTILLSRATKLKLPDAIIGATAIIYDAEIVTRDPHFLNCRHEKLRIWKNA